MDLSMDLVYLVPVIAFVVVVMFYLGWLFNSKIGKKSIASAESRAKQIIADAEKEANNIKREKLLEVKDEWLKRKQEFDTEINQKKQKIQNYEKQLSIREENIDKKYELIIKKEKDTKQLEKELAGQRQTLDTKACELDRLISEQNTRLERTAGLTSEDAKKMLMENMINQAKSDAAVLIKEVRDQAKLDSKKEAQRIVIQAIQRTAVDHSVETTVSVVQIQNEEMKGRIIGREGRNIRAFEAATGVDVIVDDTPEAVILSAFDQFRREVARLSLERLIADGRIHPARIEEIVEKVRVELEEATLHEGESTFIQLGLHGAHQEIIKHVGRMK
ncbi:MAG: Rnase Y domain-containing protein, partial [Bacillota bacterium]